MSTCPTCGTISWQQSTYCFKCGSSLSYLTATLQPDTLLQGRYKIVDTLGKGGMGSVYKAYDQRLNNSPVAIKEMLITNVQGENLREAIETFQQEAKILTTLRHEALPRIIDFFNQGIKQWFLVMDYIDGVPLKNIVTHKGPFPEGIITSWAITIAKILDYLHSCNPPIIFRDLKPSNIMITKSGELKLIDFGIARHFKEGNSTDTIALGSTGFAPPEQYGHGQTDERADIYAWGATLHYLSTGIDPAVKPFYFIPPSKFTAINPSLEQTILKAVQLNPDDRFKNFKEVLQVLKPLSKSMDNSHELNLLATLIKEEPALLNNRTAETSPTETLFIRPSTVTAATSWKDFLKDKFNLAKKSS